MKNESSTTALKIATALGIDRRKVEAHIRILKRIGLIERKGANKNGRWIVKV